MLYIISRYGFKTAVPNGVKAKDSSCRLEVGLARVRMATRQPTTMPEVTSAAAAENLPSMYYQIVMLIAV
jgi:hypothetical protein